MSPHPNKRARTNFALTERPKKSAEKLSVRKSQKYSQPKPSSSKASAHLGNPPVAWRPTSTFKVIAGSYEKLLYGLEGHISPADDPLDPLQLILKPIFIFPAHASSIKTVTASPVGGKWLATGSADEVIKVWDLRRRRELGGLIQHQGSITQLAFFSQSHLMSASEDGTLCLFRARDWTLLRTFKGHKGRVNGIAVHPSGKLFLSVGKDRTIRMWDLMRGKASASTKIGKEGELVRWSPSGTLFALQALSTIDIYDASMALVHQIVHRSRVQDIKFLCPAGSSKELILVSSEDKLVSVYDIDKDFKVIAEFTGHTSRVKAIDLLSISLSSNTKTFLLSTASSDGKIHIYDTSSILKPHDENVVKIQPLASYDTKGSRLTSICMADGELFLPSPQTSSPHRVKRRAPSEDERPDEEMPSESESESVADSPTHSEN